MHGYGILSVEINSNAHPQTYIADIPRYFNFICFRESCHPTIRDLYRDVPGFIDPSPVFQTGLLLRYTPKSCGKEMEKKSTGED